VKGTRGLLNRYDLVRARFWIQLGSFGFLVYGGLLAVDLGTSLPTFACAFVGAGRGATCYLYPLQHQMNMPLAQFAGGRGIGFAVGLATFLFLFLFLNKSWCGFVCPLGTLQDWISRLRSGLRIRYGTFGAATSRRIGRVKYLLLALLVLLPLGMANSVYGLPKLSHEWATPFCMVCPGRTILPLFAGDLSQLMVQFSSVPKTVLTGLGMAFTGVFLAGAFYKRRFFCLLCPMSALQYLCSRLAFLRLTKDGAKCTRCGDCARVCDVGIREIADDVESRNIVQEDCMMCFNCVGACPEDGCLRVSLLGASLYASTEQGFFYRTERKARRG